MSLYLKYRPATLEDYEGNKPLVDAMESLLARDIEDIPRVILLHGPSGCGKTTLARIFAERVGIHPNDMTELDVGSFRGIDMVRDIRKNMWLKPAYGTHRGWIFDEAHQLTKDAQEALLKPSEDTPPSVFFFFATTEPTKLAKTLLNRCTQFQVEEMKDRFLMSLIKKVSTEEDKKVSQEVMRAIVRESMGSPRASLVILDKIIDMDSDEQEAMVVRVAAEENEAIELCRALIQNKGWKTVSGILKGLKDKDPEGIRRVVLGYANVVLLNEGSEDAFRVLSAFEQPFFNSGHPGLTASCWIALGK